MTRSSLIRQSAALLLFAALLSGCSKTAPNSNSSGAQTPPATTTEPKQAAAGSSNAASNTGLVVEPSAVSLAPGAKTQLAVSSIKKDQSKQSLSGDKSVSYSSSAADIVTAAADGTLTASAQAKTGQTAIITVQYGGVKKDIAITVKSSLSDTIAAVSGVPTVTSPDALDVVVNKQRNLPSSYIPKLVEPNVPFTFKEKNEKRMMRPEAAKALEQLYAAAKQDGIQLYGISAYRSYATQKSIYNNNVKTQGEKLAAQFSANPGQSEHQTGLAIDVGDGNPNCAIEQCFADSPTAQWLVDHAADAGFILRYPKGKESITGYQYEPWHIRFVGVEVAKDITKQNLTFEEYFQDAVAASAKPKQ